MSFKVDLDSAVLESDYYKDDTANKPERKSTGFNPEVNPTKESAPFSVDLESAELDEKANQGVIGTLVDGAKSTARAISSTYNTYTGDGQAVVDNAQEQELANDEKSQDIKNFQSDFAANTGAGTDEEVGLWGAIKGTGKAIVDNPRGAALSVVEQFPNSVPTLAAGWAGAKGGAMAGGAVGSAFGGVGAGPGALIGGAVGFVGGMFLGNTLTETGYKAQEYAADGEFTPDEQSAAMTEGAKKAGVITAVDAITFGIGGKVSSTMRRTAENAVEAATRKTLLDAGVDISDTAALTAARSNPQIASQVVEAQKNAAKIADNLRKRAGEAGALLTMETVGEGLGEYLGELAATGQASVADAVLESFLSLGQSGVQSMFNFAKARERSLTDQEWIDASNGIAPEGMAPEQMPVADGVWDQPTPEAKIDMGQMQGGGVTPTPVFDTQDIDRNLGPTPSQQMGINPDAGPLSAAAAQSVDSGLFAGGFTPQAGINQSALEREGVTPPPVLDADQIDRNLGSIDPLTGEYMPAPGQLGQSSQAGGAGNYEYDQWGNLSSVDGRTVEGYGQNQPRLGFNNRAERSAAPLYEVGPDGVARPTSGETARSRKERIDLSTLEGRQQTQAQKQPAAMPEQRTPEQIAQHSWDSMNTFERNAAAANVLGMRGVPAKNAATKAWDKLSSKQQAKLVTGLENQQGKRWIDPNQKVTDQTGPVLQNRDRTNGKALEQMRDISNKPDYMRLGYSRDFGNGAPVIEEGLNLPAGQLGKQEQMATSQGRRIPAQYAVIEADQLLPSNQSDGTVNTTYATGEEGKSRAIAGNGRVAGLQAAWRKGNAATYKTDMIEDAGAHGIDGAVIQKMKQPVLVRVMPRSEITQNIGDESNRSSQLDLNKLEQAKTDIHRLNLPDLKYGDNGQITPETVMQFIQSMPSNENLMIDGEISSEATDRLETAVFHKAYNNDKLTVMQSQKDDESKSIIAALLQAAPHMIKLEGAGEVYDIRPLIIEAAMSAINARRRGIRLSEYVKQAEMGISPQAYPIMEMMLNDKGAIRSGKYIGEQFIGMVNTAFNEADKPSTDMYGDVPKRTQEQTIKDSLTGVEGHGQLNVTGSAEVVGQQGRPESATQVDEGQSGRSQRPADTRQAAPAQPEAEQGQPATVENEAPEKWRSNYLSAAKVARDLGIDPKQHKKLDDLVAAIDAFNAEPVASQPQQQVAVAKPAEDNKTSVHIDNATDLTGALAAIARGAQLSTEPNGDVILSGTKIITLPQQPTSVDEVIGALAVALRDQMRADGVSMPGNPADMTRDQFVVAYEFANIIPEFEITGEDIGGVVQGSSSGLTVDADKLYDKIVEQTKGQSKSKAKETPTKPNSSKVKLEASKTTMDEWVESEIENSKYADDYRDDPQARKGKVKQLEAQWRKAVVEAAKDGRIQTEVLDDFVSREGETGLLRTFRGEYEAGIEGYDLPSVRTWDKTYAQYMAQMSADDKMMGKGSHKSDHARIVRNAIARGEPVPANVRKQVEGTAKAKQPTLEEISVMRDELIQSEDSDPFSDAHTEAQDAMVEALIADATSELDAGRPVVYRGLKKDSLHYVLTPSAKEPGKFQLTRYNNTGALSDSQYKSVEAVFKGESSAFIYGSERVEGDTANELMMKLVTAESDYQSTRNAQQEEQAPSLDLSQQTEETLAAEAERLEQLQKEEAAQKAKQKAAESKARERDADKARADEVVDDFQLGQSAEEVMSGMGDIFATESKPKAEPTKTPLQSLNEAIDSIIEDQRAIADDWKNREYKNAKGSVQFEGDGPSAKGSMSINAINEGRRKKAIEQANNSIAAAKKLKERAAVGDGEKLLNQMVLIYNKSIAGNDSPTTAEKDAMFEARFLRSIDFDGKQSGATQSNSISKAMLVAVKEHIKTKAIDKQKQVEADAKAQKDFESDTRSAEELISDFFDDKTKQPTTKAPAGAIEDFGEKMAGAIKDQPINSLSKNLTDEEMASQPLSALWPVNEPLSIEDNYAAAFSYAARQNIPAKPRLKYKVKRWVDAVKSMREIAKAVQDGEITKDNIGALSKTNDTASSLAAKANLLSGLDRKHWSRIGRVDVYDNAFIFDENRNKVPSPHTVIVVDGRSVFVKGKYDNDSATAVIKASLEMAEQSDVSKRGQFEIRQNRNTGELFINRKGDKEYRKLKTFPKGSLKEARDFVNNNTDELVAEWEAIKERDNVTKADVRSDTNKERTGIDYRNGKDVTSEEFGETFGFRGVEFGNWVSQGKGQKDRQGMLNAAYDALLDLAAVVGIPPKAISLNGSLGIAFGSRGRGRYSAHYETHNIVINLTKTKGAGSLAHEWFHALDNYFGRRRGVTPFDGDNAAYNKANYITYKPEPMMALKTSLNKKGLRPHLITKAEYDRRVERGVNFDADNWTPDTNHPIGVRPTVEKAFAELVSELDKSPMLARAEKIDKGKVDGYWSSIIERAARSFESYVIQRLEDQGISNQYLANVVTLENFKRDEGRYPYLTNEELKPVAEKFDTLFSTIETREEKDGNFLMFSRNNNQPNNPTTNASLLKNINDSYPALTDSVVTMLQRGRKGQKGGLVIVDSNNGADIAKAYSKATGMPIAQANRKFSDGESINGFYDTKSGITFLVGPNLDATTAPAVLLHEVTHSQQRREIDTLSMKLINGRAKEKNADLKTFLETVSQRMIDAGEYGNPLESTAYIVEQAVIEGRSQGYTLADSKFLNAIEKTLGATVANIVRDFTKMVRQFALRRGLPINITIDDLVQYAMAGVEQAAKGNVLGGEGMPSSLSVNSIKSLSDKWESKGVKVAVRENRNGTITLDKVVVKAGERGIGTGSEFMRDLISYADSKGLQVALTPSLDFGGSSIARIKRFYKSFGFVDNKGKHKDYTISESMYRDSPVRLSRAYHGTPHSFDRFSLENVGTGEGAQVYGWGLYFAENRAVAEHYRDILGYVSVSPKSESAKNRLDAALNYADGAVAEVEMLVQQMNYNDSQIAKALTDKADRLESQANSGNPYYIKAYRVIADLINSGELETKKSANLYQVDVPEKTDLLNWDGQITKSQRSIVSKSMPHADTAKTGKDLYRMLSRELGGDKHASMHLDFLGIKGIYYLDGASRKDKKGNYNYVIWDDNAVTVEAVNDQQVMADIHFIHKSQVNTPAFKKWFGDSKVVDANGEPLVVYHGTQSSEFNTFKNQKQFNLFGDKDQFYFTENQREALGYATGNADTRAKGRSGKGRVIAGFLKIEKPADLRSATWNVSDVDVQSYLEDMDMEGLYDALVSAGYDGIIYDSEIAPIPVLGDHYVVFEPTQIKSATDNNGDFDGTNPDIRYSRAPKTNSPAFKRWFGDSILTVDGKPGSRPLRLYHGTSDDISVFDLNHPNRKDTGWLGNGVYLADKPGMANTYANIKAGSAEPNVMPLYARLENPYMATLEDKKRLMEGGRKAADNFTKELRRMGHDGVILEFKDVREIVIFDTAGVKSATGNVGAYGQRPVTADEAARFGMTQDEANEAQGRGDIRFSRGISASNPIFKIDDISTRVPSDYSQSQKYSERFENTIPSLDDLRYQRARKILSDIESGLNIVFDEDVESDYLAFGALIRIEDKIHNSQGDEFTNRRLSRGVAFINGELYEISQKALLDGEFGEFSAYWSPVVSAPTRGVANVYEKLNGKQYPVITALNPDDPGFETIEKLKAKKGFVYDEEEGVFYLKRSAPSVGALNDIRYSKKQGDMFSSEFAGKRAKGNINSDGNQIAQTKQALNNFKSFFSDSKAVDQDGRPLVMYHSTNADITQFEQGRKTKNYMGILGDVETARDGIFVTPDRDFSQEYLRDGDGQNVMQLYLSAKNPADLRYGVTEEISNKLSSVGYNARVLKNLQSMWEAFDHGYEGYSELVKSLKDAGYDSAIISDEGRDGVEHDTYVAFDSSQLKSVTGNQGSYRGGDIRFSRSQTKTPAFKRWFGDSKVVDANGEPTVMYHGTASDFSEFSKTKATDKEGRKISMGWGKGKFYFASTGEAASSSAQFAQSTGRGSQQNVMPVYLSIENPIDAADYMSMVYEQTSTGKTRDAAIAAVDKKLKKQGVDGIVDSASGGMAVFEPTQIKSATGNNGDFDPTNPDIRYSRTANPASVGAAPNGMAAWDSPSASKFDDFVYKIQDKHVDTKRVIAAIRDTGKAISDDLDVYLQETLFHGRAAKRTQDFLNKEVNPLIEYMQSAKVEMSDLEEFLHARHAQEANALIAKRDPNMPDGGSGMTNAEAANYLNSLNGVRRKQFENAAKMVDKIISGTRETIVNYGLESQETVDGWTAGFKHYIPLQREDKDGQMGIGQGFSVKGKETKGRTGSTRKVVDILANVMMQRERAIVRGEKNRVAAALLGLAKDNPLPDFWKVDVVPTSRVIDKATGMVRNQADPMYKSRDNAVVAKVNGKEHAILMNEDDPRAMRMAEALKNLDAAQLEGLLGATATATRYFAAVNTQYNPIFGVTNFVRDIQEAMLHLQSTPLAGQQARLFKNTFTAVGAVMKAERAGRKGNNATGKWGVLWEDFQSTGGQTGFRDQFSNSADRGKEIQRALTPDGWAETGLGKLFTANGVLKAPLEAVRKKAAWLFDLLSDYNTAMENGVRLSAYETGINSGMSKEQAAALAKGLTVNFNRKGQVTQQVGALYAFFNASVQGSARLGQSLFDMDAGKPKTLRLSSLGKKIVSGGVLLGASQAVLLAMMGFDDEEPPEFIRERNIIIPTGGKTYISIPMPLGYHVIANLGRIPTEFALGGGKDGAKHLFSLLDIMSDVYNPLGSSGLSMQTIAPTVLDPLAGLAENKDFSGRAIAKESFNRQTPGHALARDTASLPATWLAEMINYATGGTEFTRGELSPTPDQIDYLVGQLTGGVGRETTKLMQSSQAAATGDDLPWHKIPLVGRFIGDADSDGAKQSAFYNSMDKVRKHAEEVKGLRASGRSSEAAEYANKYPQAKLHLAARAAEKQVKDMRDRKRDLEQAGAPREEIRALEKRMIQRMEQFADLAESRK